MNAPGRNVTEADEAAALKAFRAVWSKHQPEFKSTFMGVPTYQNPLDAWVVQEVIVETAPDVMIEAGTAKGGSAMLWAMLLREVNPSSRIITIDIEDDRALRAKNHPLTRERVSFVLGSSTSPETIAKIEKRVAGQRVLVLLDSLHTKEHIAAELEAYAPMVSVGSYVIVQDTALGGDIAITEFLEKNPQFQADRSRERFVLTNSRLGYLKRIR